MSDYKDYIQNHIESDHDYSYATEERPYDLRSQCDCRRMADKDTWEVAI